MNMQISVYSASSVYKLHRANCIWITLSAEMKAIILIKDALIKKCTRMLGSANLHLSLLLKPGNQTQFSSGLLDLILVQTPGQPSSSQSQVLGSWSQRPTTADAEALALPVGSVWHTAFPATPRTSMLLGNSAFKNHFTETNVRTHRSMQTLWNKLQIPLQHRHFLTPDFHSTRIRSTKCHLMFFWWQFHHRVGEESPNTLAKAHYCGPVMLSF